MRFAWGAIGLGLVIYAVMYLLWSGLVIYGLAAGVISLVVRLAALTLATGIAAHSLRVLHWKELLPFTLSWAGVAIVLDAILLVPFSGWALFATWSVWLGYALVAAIPLLISLWRARHLTWPRPR